MIFIKTNKEFIYGDPQNHLVHYSFLHTSNYNAGFHLKIDQFVADGTSNIIKVDYFNNKHSIDCIQQNIKLTQAQ